MKHKKKIFKLPNLFDHNGKLCPLERQSLNVLTL